YTDVFDMETRPELILLQKSMVIVEGVARGLDPNLNMWGAAEPVAREWMEANLGLSGRLKQAGRGVDTILDFVVRAPALLTRAETAATSLSTMAGTGLRFDQETLARLNVETGRTSMLKLAALWIGALSLSVIAVLQLARL
ncbi:MAG: ubiquinone biosynthesis protein UbiB, partial [Hyphomicrobium sp.]|nr:ubiquinone biosynthesis protein UbiB [Hyphomicrobium sp.]